LPTAGGSKDGVHNCSVPVLRNGRFRVSPAMLAAAGVLAVALLLTPLAKKLRPRTPDGTPRFAPDRDRFAVTEPPPPPPDATSYAGGTGGDDEHESAPGVPLDQEEPEAEDVDPFAMGVRLAERGDLVGALAAFQRTDERGSPAGATNVGVLLEQLGDLEGAVGAYRRADARGDAGGAFNLAGLLAERGDFAGALDAYSRADERGDAHAALNRGILLAQQGDIRGGKAALQRAVQRGDRALAAQAQAALADLSDRPGR
jgi:tetratricopeptide (TPR) repeat protein